MSEPIRTKPKSSMKIDNAPTPHNTPASVVNSSFLKNGNPVRNRQSTSGSGGTGEPAEKGAASTAESAGGDVSQPIEEEGVPTALSNQPLLLQSIQEKLGSLVGHDSGYVDQLPPQIKKRIYGLKKLQNDLFDIEKEFQVEMFELEQKYLQKYAPLHGRRRRIVIGEEEPLQQEIKKGREIEKSENKSDQDGEEVENDEEEEEDVDGDGNEEIDVKGIPSFWLTALENLPVVSDTITDRDAEVLDYLQDVQLEYLTEGKPGFILTFTFDKDTPFFDNEVLKKTYYYQTELGYSGDFIYDHAKGDKINWTDNESNVTIAVEKRKQRNKVTKQVRTIEKITPVESFFNFFDPPRAPNGPENASEENQRDVTAEDGLEDEEELEELEQRLALDYSIGEQLKDKLIPRAIDWFTGAALEFEFDDDQDDEFEEGHEEDDEDEDENDEDDGDDDDDDDDGDEEEEEDDFAGKKENPPECKQS